MYYMTDGYQHLHQHLHACCRGTCCWRSTQPHYLHTCMPWPLLAKRHMGTNTYMYAMAIIGQEAHGYQHLHVCHGHYWPRGTWVPTPTCMPWPLLAKRHMGTNTYMYAMAIIANYGQEAHAVGDQLNHIICIQVCYSQLYSCCCILPWQQQLSSGNFCCCCWLKSLYTGQMAASLER